MSATTTRAGVQCFHCGEECTHTQIKLEEKVFCCEGCRVVYSVLSQEGLTDYYALNETPGINQRAGVRKDKFAFLDDPKLAESLISFKDDSQVHVNFYMPQMHCSSCLYLLENLHRLDEGVISSKVNFTRKEATVVFHPGHTSLRKVAELLARIGYEPYISLHDLKEKRPAIDKRMIYRLGIAGFCFGNIMLMSFPEYLGLDASDLALRGMFRWLNFLLSLPVFLYSAYPFYESSWKSLRHRFLNIDAPIALAVVITFVRSAWEVLSGTGAGYFDSMTGIVFFMLAGRILQDKTYRQLSFDRDYTSYFPVAVTVLKADLEQPTALPDIRYGDTLLIHNEELIPADGILTKGQAYIDYSFVTGESAPVRKETGEMVYAGGKQTGGNIEILVMKEVAQSYLTALWGREELKNESPKGVSFVHLLSRYFTYVVFVIAALTAWYWYAHDPAKIWTSVTAIFIIACPCALLLSNTFTNGSILRILGRNQFYLRSAQTIESVARIDHIVFDKTGTLTSTQQQELSYFGKPLTELQQQQIGSLASCSVHPLSKLLAREFETAGRWQVTDFSELPGEGISGRVKGAKLRIGNNQFAGDTAISKEGTVVYVSIDGETTGYFKVNNHYREDVPEMVNELRKRYRLSVLTGDNESEKLRLQQLLGDRTQLLFFQKPNDKLDYIKRLQEKGEQVMMIGDGLNDAGALKQANIGVAISEDSNNFTPASDAIIAAGKLSMLTRFIGLCKANQRIVMASFILSIVYNLIGLFFAVQGNLSPLVAAILMPSSSLCIFLVTFGSSYWLAKKMNL
jgi:Cu+-exporting ATPase